MTQNLRPVFDNKARTQLSISLLLLRLGIAAVMVVWTVDKILRPEHAAIVFEKYYMYSGLSAVMSYVIGVAQALVVIAFIVGLFRTWSYGLILLMHTVSVASSWKQYIAPYENLNILFYAAIPMLSACIALWMLRRFDAYTIDACWLAKPDEASSVSPTS